MDKKIAFLFPGQGSQTVGMGRALADAFPIAKQTFEEADEALGFALSKIIFEGPEDELRLTENTQPAILTVSVAAWRVLEAEGIKPAWAAGQDADWIGLQVVASNIPAVRLYDQLGFVGGATNRFWVQPV